MRERLRHLGYHSTLHYLEAMCDLVAARDLRSSPHPNPGLLSAEWIRRLAAVSPKHGTNAGDNQRRSASARAAHDNAPDNSRPSVCARSRRRASKGVPFTTGLLIGIGETREDRVDTLLAIRDLHKRYGHIPGSDYPEFRVKAGIPMQNWPEPARGDMLRTSRSRAFSCQG